MITDWEGDSDKIQVMPGRVLAIVCILAAHSSTLSWKIPWVEEPGGLQSMGLRRVRHD